MNEHNTSATTPYEHMLYNLQHLVADCAKRQQYDKVRKCLSSFKYLQTKVNEVDPYSLIQDFEYLTGDTFFDELRTALELAAPALVADPSQLGGQLIGRLGERRVFQNPELGSKIREFIQSNLTGRLPVNVQQQLGEHQELIASILRNSNFAWFQPLFASLNPADSILVRRINSASYNRFSDFTLLKDNRTCLALDSWNMSGTSRRLSYYDLKSGQTFFETSLPISSGVYKLELSPDQTRLLIYERDILVWDVENRKLLDVIQQESRYLTCLKYTVDSNNSKILIQSFLDGHISIFNFSANKTILIDAHKGKIEAFQISPNSKLLVTGGEDKFVRLWDIASGNKLAEHSLHPHSLNSVDISIDGLWAKTISYLRRFGGNKSDITTLYWNLNNYEVSRRRPPKSYYQNDVIINDKNIEFKQSNETIQVFDALRQKLLYSFKAHSRTIGKIQITSDNQYLVSIADDQGMLVWSDQTIINSQKKVELYSCLLPHNDEISSTAITSDAKYGVTASLDGTVTIWNMDSQTVRYRFKQLGKKSNYAIVITPDDRSVIAGGEDGAMCAWNIETGAVIGMFGYYPVPQQNRHQESIQTIAVHPSSSVPFLASGSGNGLYGFIGSDRGELKLWNYFRSTHIADLYIGNEQIKRTLFSPKGNTCVFATGFTLTPVERDKRDSTLFVVDIEQGRINKIKLDFKAVGDIVFSSDGRFLGVSEGSLLANDKDKPIALIFHTDSWQIVHKCFLDDASGYIESLRFTNDCTILLGGIKGGLTERKGQIYGWNITQSAGDDLKPFYTYIGHSGDVNQVELTSDDHYLISTGSDQTIRLWSLKQMQELAIFQTDAEIQHFSMATDNRTILIGSADGRVHIFKIHV